MNTTELVAFVSGRHLALQKLGMDAKHHKLIQRLQEAVVDEHDGEQEYAETAEEAKRQNLKEIESMARSHQSDEARHGQENRAALHQLYLKE